MDPNTVAQPEYPNVPNIIDYLKNYKSAFYGYLYIITVFVLSLLNDYFHFSFFPYYPYLSNIDITTIDLRYYGAIVLNMTFLIGMFLLPILAYTFYHEYMAKPDNKILKFHVLIGISLYIVLLGAQWLDLFLFEPSLYSNVIIHLLNNLLEQSIFPVIITAIAVYRGGNVFLNGITDNTNSKKLVIFVLLNAFLLCPLAYIGQLTSPYVLALLPASLLESLFGGISPVILYEIIIYMVLSVIDLLYLLIIGILILVLSRLIPVFNKKQYNIVLAVTILSIIILNVYVILNTPLYNRYLASMSLQNFLIEIFNLSVSNMLYCYAIGFIASISCLFWKSSPKKVKNI